MSSTNGSVKNKAHDEFPQSDELVEDYSALKLTLNTIQDENNALKQDNLQITETIKLLRAQVDELQKSLQVAQNDLTAYDERHATILSELNGLKESIMDSNRIQQHGVPPPMHTSYLQPDFNKDGASLASSQRSIPAPSKVLLDANKKKDNRLVELRRITKEFMNVSDEEAGLRLYKLQKTMIHVVSDLKKYMLSKQEDLGKSWKSIEISTQRVAFEMVEKEATSLGVPLNMCIGYWGARRLISKSWANALRTSKKHVNTGPEPADQQLQQKLQQQHEQQQHEPQALQPEQQQQQQQQQQQEQQVDQLPVADDPKAMLDTANNNNTNTTHDTQDDVSSPLPDDRPAKKAKLDTL